jgi:transposase
MDIIAAYREVGTFRGAAAMCGTTDKTVKRVIARQEAGGEVVAPQRRERNDDDVVGLVTERVEKTKGRISAKRLLPAARAAGYAGSARNFRRLVAAKKALWRQANHRGRRPAVWSPGQYLVIDWGEIDWAGTGRLHVFCAVLAWCRTRFVRFALDERAATTLRLLAECLETLGGVPGVVLADRMGCLKGAVVANRVVPTGEYLRFAAHYGFRPDFCEAADPESKGIVERLVGYAKSDLVVPGIDATGEPFDDLVTANVAAAAWCTQVNAAIHSEISAVPAERLAVERELLGPLPSLRPSVGRALTRKVDRLACVRFGSARYSVPVRLIGEQVRVRTDDGRLLVILTADGEVVAEHPLVAPGEASILDAHYGGPRPAPRRAVRPKTAAEQQFCALGPVAEAFLVGAAAAGNTRLGPELAELNTLAAAHGCQPFLDALGRAVAFGRWRAADVRSILAAGAGTPQPAPAGDALILELPVVPTRSLADYALHPAAFHPAVDESDTATEHDAHQNTASTNTASTNTASTNTASTNTASTNTVTAAATVTRVGS